MTPKRGKGSNRLPNSTISIASFTVICPNSTCLLLRRFLLEVPLVSLMTGEQGDFHQGWYMVGHPSLTRYCCTIRYRRSPCGGDCSRRTSAGLGGYRDTGEGTGACRLHPEHPSRSHLAYRWPPPSCHVNVLNNESEHPWLDPEEM